MTFNVLTEPWINVIRVNGQKDTIGLLDLYAHANEYRDILCDTPIETYALYRFLIAFAMDAYGLERTKDRKKLFMQGSFGKEIDSYIDLCKSEGVTFDLFDKNRPFYQARYEPQYDKGKEKSIAYLFPYLPTGNNPTHFTHRLEDEYSLEPGRCFIGLLTIQIFSVAMVQGYPSSVNDTPCYYSILHGDNVFETIVLSMISKAEAGEIDWDSIMRVAWRDSQIIRPKEQYAEISIMAGLTWQPRRITFIPEDDGNVKRMYYQQGRSFSAFDNKKWRDPHVTYVVRDGNKYSLKPKLGRQPWRDVGAYSISKSDEKTLPAVVLGQARMITNRDRRNLNIYGVITNQAKYIELVSERLTVPSEILDDIEKADRLRMDLEFIEEVGSLLRFTVKQLVNVSERTKDNKNRESHLIDEAVAGYYADAQDYFFKDYVSALRDSDCSQKSWSENIIKALHTKIKNLARSIINTIEKSMVLSAREIQSEILVISGFKTKLNALGGKEI